jgi:hypothetical protein
LKFFGDRDRSFGGGELLRSCCGVGEREECDLRRRD